VHQDVKIHYPVNVERRFRQSLTSCSYIYSLLWTYLYNWKGYETRKEYLTHDLDAKTLPQDFMKPSFILDVDTLYKLLPKSCTRTWLKTSTQCTFSFSAKKAHTWWIYFTHCPISPFQFWNHTETYLYKWPVFYLSHTVQYK
jgi:hypothetical protein